MPATRRRTARRRRPNCPAPSPADSCSLANFFVGDPNLKQVVAHTIEAGLRGAVAIGDSDRFSYDLGFYRSNLDDDIVFVNSVTLNRAFFTNIGQTRRQGVDASIQYKAPRWSAYLVLYLHRRDVPKRLRGGRRQQSGRRRQWQHHDQPGDRLPGVPAHRPSSGVTLQVTDQWTVGAVAHRAKRRVPVRRRGQPDAAAARLRHAEPEHQLPVDAATFSCSPRSRT